jgi:hypothetical protein
MKRRTTPKTIPRVATVPGNTLVPGFPSTGKTLLMAQVLLSSRQPKQR